jgi:hypothetical protein
MGFLRSIINFLADIIRAIVALFFLIATLVFAGLAIQQTEWRELYIVGAALCFIFCLYVKPKRRVRYDDDDFGFEIVGVESPRRRRRLFRRKPPEATPELFFELCCTQVEIKTAFDRAELMRVIERHMQSRNYCDYSRDAYDNYWEPASTKQLGFLQSLNYKGKLPKHMGEASNMITACLMVRDFLLAKSSTPPAADASADFISLWNSATAAGTITARDAAQLLATVLPSRETPARRSLVAELGRIVSLGDATVEIPADLFALAQSWLASLTG